MRVVNPKFVKKAYESVRKDVSNPYKSAYNRSPNIQGEVSRLVNKDNKGFGGQQNAQPRGIRNIASDAFSTGKGIFRSGMRHFSSMDNVKTAAKGVVKSSAADGAIHAGIAAVTGDDPWEAAKSGAVQGAFLGAGYMGMKGALGVEKKFGRGGMKQMGQHIAGRYNVNKEMSNISKPLQVKLQNDRFSEMARSIYDLK